MSSSSKQEATPPVDAPMTLPTVPLPEAKRPPEKTPEKQENLMKTDPPVKIKQEAVVGTMIINDNNVTIYTSLKVFYKVIRVLNHYIEHIMKHYQDDDAGIVPSEQWYIKWKTIYPMIKSSRRTIVEVYYYLMIIARRIKRLQCIRYLCK